jgi:hypothetical protein
MSYNIHGIFYMITTKKKTTVPRKKHSDERWTGPEPKENVTIINSGDVEYIKALNWYNYYYDNEQAKLWIIEYLNKNNYDSKLISSIKSVPTVRIITTVGWMAKLMMRGWNLPEKSMQYFEKRIQESATFGVREKKVEVTKPTKPVVVNIQQKVQAKARELRAKLDTHIDAFTFEDDNKNFSLYKFLQVEKPSPVGINLIVNYVNALYQELLDKEGYEHLAPVKYKSWLKFHEALVDDANRYHSNMKITRHGRKPRAIKAKPASKLIEKLKYKKEDVEQKIVSVDPIDIIKAESLWVYNTKYRQLSVYYAIDDGGLSVKGTTITQFDEKRSVSKRLRKPNEIIPKLLKSGKVVLRTFMDDIKTNTTIPTGRINEDVILLRIIK